jgi:ketosteroid isomerase-like protein
MSEKDVNSLRAALDAFNRRDRAAWLAFVEPSAVNFPPREWPENAPLHGAERIWDFYVEAVKSWDGAVFAWGEMIDEGTAPDKVVVNQRAELRGKTSGIEVLWSYWVVFTFRDEKVVRSDWFADREEALESAGGPP